MQFINGKRIPTGPRAERDICENDLSTKGITTMPAETSEPLPPDVAAARKERINNDLIEILNMPCPPNAEPFMQGIGLYTHIAGPALPEPLFPHEKYKTPDPKFLPIGGPARVRPAIRSLAQTSEEVKTVYQEIREAIDKEEREVSQGTFSIEQLRERYGALARPDRRLSTGQVLARSLNRKSSTTSIAQQADDQRHSVGSNGDVAMTGIDDGRKGSIGSTNNTYDQARDPRERARFL